MLTGILLHTAARDLAGVQMLKMETTEVPRKLHVIHVTEATRDEVDVSPTTDPLLCSDTEWTSCHS